MTKKNQKPPLLRLNNSGKKLESLSTQNLVLKGFELHKLGSILEAAKVYFDVLKLEPNNFDALHLLGMIAAQNKDYEQAFTYLAKAIEVNPIEAAAYSNLGMALHESGRPEEAIVFYKKALELNPDLIDALYNCAGSYQALNNLSMALNLYNEVLRINPELFQAHNNRGNVLQKMHRFQEAFDSYGEAIKINANFPEPYNNLGNLFYVKSDHSKALENLNKALEIRSDYAEAYNNRGNVKVALKLNEEALADFQRAIELDPSYAEPHHNCANLFLDTHRYEEALVRYELALALKPNYEYVHGAQVYTKLQICDWTDLELQTAQLITKIALGEKAAIPFLGISLIDSGPLQKQIAQTWVADKHLASDDLPPLLLGAPKAKGAKIRLGYYSTDFHNHATMYLMAKLFEAHDHSQFELFAFSFGPFADDAMRKRAVAAFDHFIDVKDQSDLEIAKLSRQLQIDIAVDLKGFTQYSRTNIFAHRAAPVQVNYLGYPGTMGASYMDYIIADRVLVPPGSEQFYTEKVVYMPHSYQVNDDQRVIADTVYTRTQLGLPDTGFVFCCFNNNYKILPPTFDGWLRILKAVPDSVLWLLEDNPTAAKNLQQIAMNKGLDPVRLIFAKRMPLAEHLARHRLADLFLDTLPCNAHTTTSDALWAGLPVLTLPGETFASRVSASLLNAIGLPELIANTQVEYEKRAIDLAQSPEILAQIKGKLMVNRKISPLFDTKQYAKDLEGLYQGMIQG
jgi:predicted O-linked N-acetylglucosamine transferase (SPINDLY family)